MPAHALVLVALALAPAHLATSPAPLVLAAARPASSPAPPLLPPPPADPRATAARAAYAAGEYVSAARQYEALARDTAAPRYLFNAGMAREAAGELSHASLLWRRYLSSGTASAEDRELLARKLAAAAASLVARRLRPGPDVTTVSLTRGDARDPLEPSPAELTDAILLEAGEWTARVQGAGEPLEIPFTVAEVDAPPVELPAPTPRIAAPPLPLATTGSLTVQVGPPRALRRGVEISLKSDTATRQETLRSATTTWELPRGAWTVSAAAADWMTTPRTVTVAEQPQRLDFTLRLSPAARRQRIVAPSILGGLGLGLVTGGAALVARGSRRDIDCLDATTCEAAANSVLDVSSGLALVGTGVGALIPAVTAAAGARSRALAAEAGVGGALFASGLTWYLAEAIGTTALDHRPREHAAAAMLGLGAGLVGSAVIHLLVRRALRDRRAPKYTHARPHHASF